MVIENDINKINQIVSGKTIDKIVLNGEGVVIYFTDGTFLKIKTYQFQLLLY